MDLIIRPAAAPVAAAYGNLTICTRGVEVEKHCFRTAWPITGQKFPCQNGLALLIISFFINLLSGITARMSYSLKLHLGVLEKATESEITTVHAPN